MRRCVFAGWALALTASSAHAFLASPAMGPAVASLRPTPAAGVDRRSSVDLKGRRGSAAKLSMQASDPGAARIAIDASQLSTDSSTYCANLDEVGFSPEARR
jgi:hypothetical protein